MRVLDLDEIALHIKTLDPDFAIRFSEYTRQWYVTAHVEVGGDGILRGLTEHRFTPEAAVRDYFLALTEVAEPSYLVTHAFSDRREQWRWNGVCFRSVPRTTTP